jgi:hypothetical protein
VPSKYKEVKKMSCCSRRNFSDTCGSSSLANGTCGSSRSTITIPANAVAAPLVCSLPCVGEFSTSISRFKNQIVRDVLIALSARCQAEVAPALPPGTTVVLSNTTTFNQSLTTTISLLIEANTITSVSVALQNVQFQIVGFASVIAQVSGEAVVTVVYQGIDGLPHTQTVTVPFVFTEIVPGTFPANSAVQGNLAIINQTVENIIDPSTLAITAVIVTLFFATNIIIVAPVA